MVDDRTAVVGRCRIRAVLEYDGTDFQGFQVQRSGRTIQGEIESALARITGRATRIVGAGRTDAGVHASGQVIHFQVDWNHSLADLLRALNASIPDDTSVLELERAPAEFHARYSARSREYEYTVLNDAARSPLRERYACLFQKPLDAEAMDKACQGLGGTHDFLAFGWPPQGECTVRTVFHAGCQRSGVIVRVAIEADAFLRSMMRRIVGNLLLVGCQQLTVDQFLGLLTLGHRRTPAVAAPARGLCLVRVNY